MPVAYLDKTLKDFNWSLYPVDTHKEQKQVEAFLFGLDVYLNAAKGLYLFSKTRGSGKTMLSCLIGNEIAARGIQIKFIPITEYVQRRFNKEDLSQYKICTVLIIDDLGAQSDTVDNIREMVYDLINSRYNGRKMTIFTSNVTMDNASKDDRIVSRLYEMAVPVKIPDISIRSQKAIAENSELIRAALRA
jgi:DNA replication protein DnaC